MHMQLYLTVNAKLALGKLHITFYLWDNATVLQLDCAIQVHVCTFTFYIKYYYSEKLSALNYINSLHTKVD